MPIDPNIALQVKPIDDYNTMLQKSMALKNAQQQSQLGTIQLQQAQQDQKDQQNLRSYYNNQQPGAQFDENAIMQAAGPKLGPQIIKAHNDMLASHADLVKKQGEIQSGGQEYVANLARAIQQAKYDPNVAQTMLGAAAQIPGYGPQVQQLQQMLQTNPGQFQQIIDGVIAQSPKQATAGKDLALGQKAQAEIPGAQAKSEQEQRILSGMTPNGINADQQATLAQGDRRLNEQTAQDQWNRIMEQKRLYNESNPTAKDMYKERQENARAAQSRQTSTSNELQKQGIASLQKQSDGYTQFLGTANSLKQSLQAATDGNQLAAAVAPLQGTLFITTSEGVKRINETELKGVEGAGSLVQRIQGALGKASGGGPLSPQLKSDMAKLVDLYGKAKYNAYLNQAKYTQKLHGIDPSTTPVLAQDGTIAGDVPAPSSGGVSVIDPSGGVHTFPNQVQADAFKKAAGIK